MRTYYLALFLLPILAVFGAVMPLDPELSPAGLLLSSVLVSPFLMRVFSRVSRSKTEWVPRLKVRRVGCTLFQQERFHLEKLVRIILKIRMKHLIH